MVKPIFARAANDSVLVVDYSAITRVDNVVYVSHISDTSEEHTLQFNLGSLKHFGLNDEYWNKCFAKIMHAYIDNRVLLIDIEKIVNEVKKEYEEDF